MSTIHCPEPAVLRNWVISRILPAPPERVWSLWTQPQHLVQWWGPHDFTNPVCELDVRAGGNYRIVMRGPDGGEFPLSGRYYEVVAGERLVMTVHGSPPVAWCQAVDREPDLTVCFEPLGSQTRLTVRLHCPSVANRETLRWTGRTEGWAESLEALSAYLIRGGG